MIKTKLNRKKETGGIEASLRDRMPYYIGAVYDIFRRSYSLAYDSLGCAEFF